MTYKEIMAAIARGEMKSVYLISGEETHLADKIERALLGRIFNGEDQEAAAVYQGDVSLETLVNAIETVPFFYEKNVVLVRNTGLFKEKKKDVGNDAEKKQRQEARLIALLEDMPDYSVLILRTNEKADKRRKLYKAVAKHGCSVEVSPIRAWEVKDWLADKLHEVNRQFDREAFAYFIEVASVMNVISLQFLEQEIDKLLLYTDKKLIHQADIREVLSSIPEVSVFAMLEAISAQDTKKALQLLADQLSAGEHPLKMITMLSRHVRQLWQAKILSGKGLGNKQIAEALGMVPFIAEKLVNKSRNFAEEALQKALIDLAAADYKLKSGQADPVLLECILIEVCRKNKQ